MSETVNTITKEVYFDQYCSKCKYKDTPDGEDPCDDCLAYPWMPNSHKPINFKEE